MDKQLVQAAISGDEEAFAWLARGSADRLFAVAYRILRDFEGAQDAVQQALVSAWEQLPSLRDVDRFDAWLHRVLVNACYAEARRARRWRDNVRALPLDGPESRDATVDVVLRDALDRGFRRLPVEQRAVFILHHYVGMPLTDVAETLGVPLGTAKSRLHYATNSLRAALDADARAATPATERQPA